MTDNVIVIGAGHNGLVCGAYLARQGMDVTILEAADEVGGGARTTEFTEGFRVSGCAHLLYQFDPEIIADLDLDSHGLRYAATGMPTTALHESGDHLRMTGTQLQGGGVTPSESTAYGQFVDQMRRFAGVLRYLYTRRPPRLNGARGETMALAAAGWKFRRMGRSDLRELLRIAGSNIDDIADERFDNDLLRGAVGLDAVLGTHLGTRSSNSVLTYLHRWASQVAGGPQGLCQVEGGLGTLSQALAKAATSNGASVRTSCPVSGIRVENGRATGVETAGGEQLDAKTIVSCADPKTTFLKLLGARHLEAGFARRIDNLRTRGNAAKLHLALDGLPSFAEIDQTGLGGRLLIAPSSYAVDRAFNPAKYGEFSPEPVMEITVPSIKDSRLAPAGKHVLSAIVQYAPYDLRRGWESAKSDFEQLVIDRLATYAPEIRDQIVASQLLTPVDLEQQFGMTGGHWHHVELALDNFMMLRPTPGTAQYQTPVDGLFLCGAGCHPGGGIMGTAGRNAAQEVTRAS